MRIRAWPVIVIVGIALVAFAVMFRDEIWDAIGNDPGDRFVYAFDGPMTPEMMERARQLVSERLLDVGATVEIDGQHLVIEVEKRVDGFDVFTRLDTTVKVSPYVELHVLDYDPELYKQVRPRLVGNKRAKELGVTLELDHVGYHLEAPTGGMYVNTAWADAHGCSTKDRLTGTGVYCWVKGSDRIAAVLEGDAGLFMEPLGVTLPAHQTIALGERDGIVRAYVIESAPIVLETVMIDSADVADDQLVLTLNRRGIDTLAARVTAPATEIVRLVNGVPFEAKLVPGGKLTIASAHADARRFISDLSFAQMPHRLRELPTK